MSSLPRLAQLTSKSAAIVIATGKSLVQYSTTLQTVATQAGAHFHYISRFNGQRARQQGRNLGRSDEELWPAETQADADAWKNPGRPCVIFFIRQA